jgi:hypothetical protein
MTTQNLYALTDTWNAGGTTFTGIGLNVTDTASASGSLLMDLQTGGASQFKVRKDGVTTIGNNIDIVYMGTTRVSVWPSLSTAFKAASNLSIDWSSTTDASGSPDLTLFRDAADTLAQRRGTNAQAFNIYNTYTDASNYERFEFGYASNVATIKHAYAGTGSSRNLRIAAQGNANIYFSTNGSDIAAFNSGGLTFQTDNTYDIGAAAATRPRNVYVGSNVHVGTYAFIGTNTVALQGISDGVMSLLSYTGTGFTRLQFGGTTSSFPALKRSTTSLQVRLADDTAFAPVQGKLTTDTAYTAGDPVTTGYLTLYDSNGTAYKVPAVAA